MKNVLKRIAVIVLTALILFAGLPAQKVLAADGAPLKTTVKVTGKNDSQKVSYTLTLSKTTLTDGHIAVLYDPEVLELTKDIEYNRFVDYDLNEEYEDENGSGIAVAFVNDAPRATSGTLITMQFNVKKGAAQQDSVITTKVFGLNNEDTEVLPSTVLEDTVSVGRAKLAKPQLKALSQTVLGVNVAWSRDENADGYVVYRSTSKDGKFVQIATTTSTSYWDTSVSNNKTYYYKVAAYQGKGADRVLSEESDALSIKVKKFFGLFG